MQTINNLLLEEQDEGAVRKIVPIVSELLTKDEQIEYIAVQNLKKAVLAMDRRKDWSLEKQEGEPYSVKQVLVFPLAWEKGQLPF